MFFLVLFFCTKNIRWVLGLTPPLAGQVAITSGFCLSGERKKIEKRGNVASLFLFPSLLHVPLSTKSPSLNTTALFMLLLHVECHWTQGERQQKKAK